MTRRDELEKLLRQRAEAILAIHPLAKAIFPAGTPVEIQRDEQTIDATVLSVDYGGETITVRLITGEQRTYPLRRVLDWNPAAGIGLADVA